jgi:hypothetical protein
MKITIESSPDSDSSEGFRYEVTNHSKPDEELYTVRDLSDLMQDINDLYFGNEIS